MVLRLLGFGALGLRRSLIVTTSYLLMVILFPWTETERLTPQRFIDDVGEKVSSIPRGQPVEDIERFVTAIFGGTKYDLARLFLPHDDYRRVELEYRNIPDVDPRLALIAAPR